MITGWKELNRYVQSHGGGSYFWKPTKEPTKVVIRGEPVGRRLHWAGSKYVECDGDRCSRCLAGDRPTFRVAWPVYLVDSGENKIWEAGVTVFRQFALLKKHYDLDSTVFEVTREGNETTVSPLHGMEIDPDALPRPLDVQAILSSKRPTKALLQRLRTAKRPNTLIAKFGRLTPQQQRAFLEVWNAKTADDLPDSPEVHKVLDMLLGRR